MSPWNLGLWVSFALGFTLCSGWNGSQDAVTDRSDNTASDINQKGNIPNNISHVSRSSDTNITSRILSRPKRYLVFPEGSTFSFAFCMTIKALTEDPDIFSEAVAVAVNYELPHNCTTAGLGWCGRPSHAVHARAQRATVFSRTEIVLDKLGVPGKDCVLRAICEGSQELDPGSGLLAQLLATLIRFPSEGAEADEPNWQWRYLAARRAGLLNYNCPDLYRQCPLSIVALINSLRPIPP